MATIVRYTCSASCWPPKVVAWKIATTVIRVCAQPKPKTASSPRSKQCVGGRGRSNSSARLDALLQRLIHEHEAARGVRHRQETQGPAAEVFTMRETSDP